MSELNDDQVFAQWWRPIACMFEGTDPEAAKLAKTAFLGGLEYARSVPAVARSVDSSMLVRRIVEELDLRAQDSENRNEVDSPRIATGLRLAIVLVRGVYARSSPSNPNLIKDLARAVKIIDSPTIITERGEIAKVSRRRRSGGSLSEPSTR